MASIFAKVCPTLIHMAALSGICCTLSALAAPAPKPPPASPPHIQPTSARGGSAAAADSALLAAAFGKLPLVFEANQGQADQSVQFTAHGPGYGLLLMGDGAMLHLGSALPAKRAAELAEYAPPSKPQPVALRMRFLGANAAVPAGEVPQEGKSHYFIGNDPSRHVTDVPQFGRVRYKGLYPGIDLVYYGKQRQLEYDFVLAPGADPAQIALTFEGADEVALDAEGDLVLRTALGEVRQHRPQIYQEVDGQRRAVQGRYVLLPGSRPASGTAFSAVAAKMPTFGIALAAYDRGRPLVIDPVLSYASFLGGSGADSASAVAIDAGGNAYIVGSTNSTNLPMVGGYQKTLGRSATNVFVAKLNPAGSALLYSSYLGGGSETDAASGIAVDAAGNAYITGTTSGSTFPTTTGAYQKGATGGGSFAAKLGPAGSTLVYSTYVLKATSKAIAVDAGGSAYLTGAASSGFATTGGAFQAATRNTASTNAFVLKLNPAGSAASYATFLGGGGTDEGRGIAVDASGNAYVGGATTSVNFPAVSAAKAVAGGMQDGFAAKLNPAGSALLYSTYLGGSNDDAVNAIAIDTLGNAYLGGETYSRGFPTTAFAFQWDQPGQLMSNTAQSNGFVTKLAPTGDALVYSTFLGGNWCGSTWCSGSQSKTPVDAVYGIAVDSLGHAHVTGIARALNFPLVDPLLPQMTVWQQKDAMFVAKLTQGGDGLLYSSYVNIAAASSGNANAGRGIALDGGGGAYGVGAGVAGFPTTAGVVQANNAGGSDAVVFKLASGANIPVSLVASPNPVTAGKQVQLSASVQGGGSSGTVTFLIRHGSYNATPTSQKVALSNGTATVTITAYDPGVTHISAVYRNNEANVGDSPPLYLTVNPVVCN